MYTRPEHIPLGIVWSRFQGKNKKGVPGLMYQIRDVDEAHKEACLDMLCETYIRDEPLCQVLGAINDQEFINNTRAYCSKKLDQNMSIACYTDVDGEPKDLVGFNLLEVMCKDDEDVVLPKGTVVEKMLKTAEQIEKLVDVFEYYGTDTYLNSSGLIVLPEHRGQNIGAKLLELRELICKTFEIKATCSTFTATSSQISATRAGFEVLATFEYSEMLKHGIDLRDCESPCAKLMGRKYE